MIPKTNRPLWVGWALALVVLLALVAVACSGAEETPASPTRAPAAPTSAPALPPVATAAPTAMPAPAAPAPAPDAMEQSGTLAVAMVKIGAPTGLPGKQTGGGPEQMPERLSVMQKLIQREGDLSYTPLLMDSYSLSDDLTSVRVNLREGVMFHDGWGEVTAEDVKWSYGHAALENPQSIHGSVGFINNHLDPLEVVDSNTVDFPIEQFTIEWERIYLGIVDITSKKRVDDLGEDAALQSVVGTGPFRMVSWTADNEFVGEAFADYWGDKPTFSTLRAVEVGEASTRVAQIKTGEVAIIDSVPISFLQDLTGSGIEPTNDHIGGSQQFVAFGGNFWQSQYHDRDEAVPARPGFKPDADHPWIGDPSDPARHESARKVREALALAIDRDLINQEVMLGVGRPEYVPYFVSVLPEHPDSWRIPYDPDRAMALLEEAGYGDGFEVPMFVAPDIGALNQEVWESVATMWANIGLTPRLDRTAYQAFRPKLVERKLEYLYAWLGGNETATMDLPRFALAEGSTWSEGDWNWGIEVNEAFDAMEKVNDAPRDKAARIAANMEIGQYLFDTKLGIGVVFSPDPLYFDPNVIASWDLKPNNRRNFESIRLK